MADDAGASRRSLADKLNHLYATVLPPGRDKPYTDREVARATSDAISDSYLNYLRRGLKTNPTKRHLEVLAGFFKVPVAYFFDDEPAVVAEVEADLERRAAEMDAPEVRLLALKARGLSPVGLQKVGEIIDYVRSLEQERQQKPGG